MVYTSFAYLNEWYNMYYGRPFSPLNWGYYGLL
jgi:hypothetical protein